MAAPSSARFVSPLDEVSAGKVIEKRILLQSPTVTRWVQEHSDLGLTTVLHICAGHYNPGSGTSVKVLQRLCFQICDGDEHAAQLLALEYLTALGLVPHSGEASLAAELALANGHLRRVAAALERSAKIAERREKREQRKAEAEARKRDAAAGETPGE